MSLAKRAFFHTLGGLREGRLTIEHAGESHEFGDPASDLRAHVTVHDPRFFLRMLTGGTDAAGDSYVDGDWSTDNLVAVIRICVRNLQHLESSNRALSWASRVLGRLAHLRRANTVDGSRRNIAAHYDLSNEFFSLFLDRDMVYSSAVYPSESATLEDAQREKLDRICRKLQLTQDDHVLEIGTGWGAFALHAASRYGCRVTTTTISGEQHAGAAARFSEAGDTARRIELLRQDYRHLQGRYSKLASIEMFEAVGLENYDTFFGVCDRLLAPGGVAALQAITMREENFASYRRNSDWIQRRVFPGGELASVREIHASVARATKLAVHHVEDFGLHYAATLEEWRRRFFARVNDVHALGFDQPFIRLWDYYLCYCEGAFRERAIGVAQLVLTK